jgi:hypothetical protein
MVRLHHAFTLTGVLHLVKRAALQQIKPQIIPPFLALPLLGAARSFRDIGRRFDASDNESRALWASTWVL